MDEDAEAEIYRSIPGGPELLRWRGGVPIFHDAEIVGLSLDREGTSSLALEIYHLPRPADPDVNGYLGFSYAVVTFLFSEVTDVLLEGFTLPGPVGELFLSRATSSEPRYLKPAPCFEILVQRSYGLAGFIRARGLEVRYDSGRFADLCRRFQPRVTDNPSKFPWED